MERQILRVSALACFLLISVWSSCLQAQGPTAAVAGAVVDATGAVVPGATVEVKNLGTGIVQRVVTDSQGRYNVVDLPIGDYTVQASQAGFGTVIHAGITLSVGGRAIVDFSLSVGQQQQSVTVEGQVSQVETTSAAVSNLVEPTQMRELPLNGRNFSQLLTLAPGVQQVTSGSSSLYGGGQNYSVAGGRPEGQAFLLDNSNISNFWNHSAGAGALGSSLGIEAIAEFQTLTNTYSAQFGGNGAVVNAVSKSGTNSIHGTAYEFIRNSALDARNFFDGASAPPFRRNQFGGSVGGPVKKDRAFFFANYEGLRQARGVTQPASVPDANARKGLVPCALATTFTCVGGLANVGVSPTVASALNVYPATSAANAATGVVTVPQIGNQIGHENYFLARGDFTLSDKDSLFLRYAMDRADYINPFNSSAAQIPLWPEQDATRNNFATIEERRIVTPSIVNLIRISFVRPTDTGITTGATPALQYYQPGVQNGTVTIAGLSTIGASTNLPFFLYPTRYVLGDDLYVNRGAHSFKFGFAVERIDQNTAGPLDNGGAWTFSGLVPFLQGKSSLFVGPLLGSQDNTRDFRELWLRPYINDDWKISSKLTLNIGLRYDWGSNPVGVRHPLNTIVDPLHDAGVTLVTHAYASNPNTKNWDPRIGFAYDAFANHKTSIRGGFGIFHDDLTGRFYTHGYWLVTPFTLGLNAAPTYPNVGGSAAPLSTVVGIDYNTIDTPYMMQYNMNVQRDIGSGTILTVGYVGSRGVHLDTNIERNPFPISNINGIWTVTGTKRLNPSPTFSSLASGKTIGSSNYNALQASLNHRLAKNWQTQVAYTFSKSLDNASSSFGLEGAGNFIVMNPFNMAQDRGRSTFDRAQALRISGVYMLPFHGNKFVDGWQFSGILGAVSGPPFSAVVGIDQAGLAQSNGAGQRPNLVAGASQNPIIGNPNRWFDPTAFALPAKGTLGSLGRTTLVGPGLFNLDFAAMKDTKIPKISETFDIQFRAEIFNLTNHTNLGLPVQQVFTGSGTISPIAGLIRTTIVPGDGSRQIQFGLKFIF